MNFPKKNNKVIRMFIDVNGCWELCCISLEEPVLMKGFGRNSEFHRRREKDIGYQVGIYHFILNSSLFHT